MRILVTGGFGFIGSHFTRHALNAGHEISIIDKMSYAANPLNLEPGIISRVETLNLDIANFRDLEKALEGRENYDWIVNFAAESHVDRSISNAEPFIESNVKGTVNILELCRTGIAKKLLQISTDEVYGSINQGSWNENAPLEPRSPYSASKASAELFCNAYSATHDLDITIVRSANNFGPNQSVEKFIPKTISSLVAGKPVTVYGKGENYREWLYVEENVRILLALIEKDTRSQKVFNIGGLEIMNLDLVHHISKILGLKPIIDFVEDRKGHDFRYSVNDAIVYNELKFEKQDIFIESLEKTVNWYLKNPKWIISSELRLQS